MSAELHRDAFRDSAAHHVPDSRSAQVVWNSSWAARGDAGKPPRFCKRKNRSWMFLAAALVSNHAEEHPGFDLPALRSFRCSACCPSSSATEIVREGEHTSVAVLRRPGVKSYLARFEIDVTPLQRQNLGRDSPAGDVGELDDGLNGVGKCS